MRLIQGSSRSFPWFPLLFALFWNAMAAVMLSTGQRPARGISPIVVYLAAGAFVLVGLVLAGWFAKALLRHLRFRGALLLLDHHTTVRTLFEKRGSVRTEPAVDGTRLRFNLPLPPEAPPSERYGESLVRELRRTRTMVGRPEARFANGNSGAERKNPTAR